MLRPVAGTKPKTSRSIGATLFFIALKAVAVGLLLATPLIGVWVATSLAAYSNGPVGLAIFAGLFLFPILPLAWEAYAHQRRRMRGDTRPRALTFVDRMIFRTLSLNAVFLTVVLATRPAKAFTALSTRGDWMLEGRAGARVDAARRALHRAADGLEWLYVAAHDNPFRDDKKDEPPPPPPPPPTSTAQPSPVPVASTTSISSAAPLPSSSATPVASSDPISPPPPGEHTWPYAATLHSVVAAMSASEETSIAGVGRYLAERERDPYLLAKAVHDWVADRIAYDGPAYVNRKFPPQDAETVFRTRTGVCAGYAHLFEAMGRAAGLQTAYLVGDARTNGWDEHGEPHAWSAVTIAGNTYLLDTTWDSGSLTGTTFEKHYRTEYFMTPASIFVADHYPDEPRWQLVSPPLSRGDFMRKPMLAPAFFADRRTLISPDRSQVTATGPLEIMIDNPKNDFTLADMVLDSERQSDKGAPCVVNDGVSLRIQCKFPAPGRYDVRLFGNSQRFGKYHYLGQIEVNAAP
jgi:transglutaminase-like putative cysteine protease